MKILVTGVAGFIGMHTALRLLERGDTVVGVDNLNDYYDINLKKDRLSRLTAYSNFSFYQTDISDQDSISEIFVCEKFERVIHFAAQVGVRYSLSNPYVYIDANIHGFTNILEGCRRHQIEHLVYASSSSVYGGNTLLPFNEHQNIDDPVSLYAATKKANELMAHTYSHLFCLPTTGLRFFTVYGPWGRPDMALFMFIRAILEGRMIDVFNHGQIVRDFTYIDDVVESVIRVLDKPAEPDITFDSNHPDPATSHAPYRIFNIGNNQPIVLLDCISILETVLGIVAKKNFLPMQLSDIQATFADTDELDRWVGFKPHTSLHEGIARFVDWYKLYYKL